MLSKSVVVLDFETTGLNPGPTGRVIEVAAIRVSGAEITDKFVSLVNPGIGVPAEITALTGITTRMLESAPRDTEVMDGLLRFIKTDVVVAHNAGFERRWLEAETARLRKPSFCGETLCTLRLSRRLLPRLRDYKLETIAAKFGIRFQPHRAEPDAVATAEVLLRLVRGLVEQHSVVSLDPSVLLKISTWPKHDVTRRLRRALCPSLGTKDSASMRRLQEKPRWRLYPSGNLRDTWDDVLYQRDELEFVGGLQPYVIVRGRASQRVQIRVAEISGPDPLKILGLAKPAAVVEKRRNADVRGAQPLANLDASRSEASKPGRTWTFRQTTGELTDLQSSRVFGYGGYRRVLGGFIISDLGNRWVDDTDVEAY